MKKIAGNQLELLLECADDGWCFQGWLGSADHPLVGFMDWVGGCWVGVDGVGSPVREMPLLERVAVAVHLCRSSDYAFYDAEYQCLVLYVPHGEKEYERWNLAPMGVFCQGCTSEVPESELLDDGYVEVGWRVPDADAVFAKADAALDNIVVSPAKCACEPSEPVVSDSGEKYERDYIRQFLNTDNIVKISLRPDVWEYDAELGEGQARLLRLAPQCKCENTFLEDGKPLKPMHRAALSLGEKLYVAKDTKTLVSVMTPKDDDEQVGYFINRDNLICFRRPHNNWWQPHDDYVEVARYAV